MILNRKEFFVVPMGRIFIMKALLMVIGRFWLWCVTRNMRSWSKMKRVQL